MANWVDKRFDSIYENIIEIEDSAYFELSEGKNAKKWIGPK